MMSYCKKKKSMAYCLGRGPIHIATLVMQSGGDAWKRELVVGGATARASRCHFPDVNFKDVCLRC